DNRARDAAAGRTTDGPHLTDLEVLYGPKGIAAAQASTGEQKALLIALVLAHAGLVAEMTGFAPLLLLDEVIAHLDPGRRTALFVQPHQRRCLRLRATRRSTIGGGRTFCWQMPPTPLIVAMHCWNVTKLQTMVHPL